MAGASDKARFYLEQSVPELQEYERKKIFSKVRRRPKSGLESELANIAAKKDEISSIAKKRSDFEHKLNARGSQPADYARYAEYEMNLEALRRKRVRRLGVKASNHAGQRRIFFVLERATRKFHGDVGLWMQYIEYARKEKAHRKLSQIFTSVVRLHPTKAELWIYAATYAMEVQADMTEARSYMQRGLRFCRASKPLWLEYAKLEMIYLAKIVARRRILGLDQDRLIKTERITETGSNEDVLALPEITAEDVDPAVQGDDTVDRTALENLSNAPALSGAIPLAVFDTATKQFPADTALFENFFDLFASFPDLPFLPEILDHVVTAMLDIAPTAPSSLSCHIRQPVVGIEVTSVSFPRALRVSMERLRLALDVTESRDFFVLCVFLDRNLASFSALFLPKKKLVSNLARDGALAGLYDHVMELLEALLDIVGLLTAAVSLNDDGVGFYSSKS
ncbi:MAG: U3 snoRNP protein [Thelocarpon impressellum]|nr:MAG: U3 snoRNP protein [Thelocarpon impressellum]